ncbi:MAG: type IV pilus modification protein PilV [Gammaproteobacteria bacterium]|jgi:type IV pilus assembly protein PilV
MKLPDRKYVPRQNVKGVSLIEVLVSLLILSLGLLGVAGLQTTSLRSNQTAYFRSQATAAASDIIDRMRANPQGVAAGKYDDIDSASLPGDPNCIASGCSAENLADYDILDWSTNTLSSLPSGAGTVSVDDMGTNTDATDDVFVVTISWSDATDQANQDKNLVVRFQL